MKTECICRAMLAADMLILVAVGSNVTTPSTWKFCFDGIPEMCIPTFCHTVHTFFLVEPLDKIKVNLGLIFLCILFVLDSIVASLLQGEQS